MTEIYVHDTDAGGGGNDAYLDTLAAGDKVKIFQTSDVTKWAIYAVVSNTDSGAYHTLVVTFVAANSTFADGAPIGLTTQAIGPQGAT